MGLPWQALWDAVQYANIRKERVPDDGSGHHFGVVKPPGWKPPNIKAVLDRYTDLALAVPQADIIPEAEDTESITHKMIKDAGGP